MQAQAVGLRSEFPKVVTTVLRGEIRWQGELSPDDYGRTYAIEMRYRQNDRPQVWVRAPDLHSLTGGRRLPHVYDQGEQRLCLYVPGCGFWRPGRALCRTILPWTCYWLRLFEVWLVTNVWHERGVHPAPKRRRRVSADVIRF
jgi:hypothetical protein